LDRYFTDIGELDPVADEIEQNLSESALVAVSLR
jgi:hypothetical protein